MTRVYLHAPPAARDCRTRQRPMPLDDGRAAVTGGGAGTATDLRRPGPEVLSHAPVPVPPPQQRRRSRQADHWPLCSYLEFGALPGAVPCARLHSRQLLWEWGLTDLSATVELLVAELLTNAVQASRALECAPPVRLWLACDKARVVIAVWDASPRPPARSDADVEDEAGRGLLLVEALSTRWGWYRAAEPTGKVVWAAVGDQSGTDL